MFTPNFSASYGTRWVQGSIASRVPLCNCLQINFCFCMWENELFWLIPKYVATGVFSASPRALDPDQSPLCLA